MNVANKVIYQIYPKSFCDSNGDGYGDLKGVISKLDYLKELGIDCVWLTPFFISPQADNGYDIADYYKIDPKYGTMEDTEELIRESSKRNMTVMFDMVLNHTSTEHEWFQKALNGDPVYQDYYFFKDGVKGNPPTNWVSKFGGNAWEYVESLHKYYLHLFDKKQADLNWSNPAVRKEVADIVRFWMNKGVKGFRFDVVNLISKPDVFEDDYQGDGRRFYTDGKHVHEYLRELNRYTFGKNPEIITVGEMSSTDISNCILYAGKDAEELNMTFSFHHLKVDYLNGEKWQLKPFDFKELKSILNTWQVEMEKNDAWNALFWNNHDQPRAVSRFCSDVSMQPRAAKMLAACMHMMRGTPYVYQGEELGMTNPGFNHIDQYRDVESKNYYRILRETESEEETMKILQARSRDNSRTPMQWDDSEYAGFSTTEPWISVNQNKNTINAEKEKNDPASVYAFYKKLIQIRKDMPVIQEGTFIPLLEEDEKIYAYQRSLNGENIIILCNFYNTVADCNLNIEGYRNILDNTPFENQKNSILQPYEVRILHHGRNL